MQTIYKGMKKRDLLGKRISKKTGAHGKLEAHT